MWRTGPFIGDKTHTAENPPYGALISYYLKAEPKDRVTVTVADQSGTAIRELADAPRTAGINRVTVYRILDLLASKGLVERLSGGGRSLVYGMAPNKNHPAHPHFHCKTCGGLQCLHPGSLKVDLRGIKRSFTGEVQGVEVRVDGICRNCLKRA